MVEYMAKKVLSQKKYASLKIPRGIVDEINKLIAGKCCSMYSNHTDFIKETLRSKIEELKKSKT